MGIDDLVSWLRKHPKASDCFMKITLEHLRGQAVVIDGSLIFTRHWKELARRVYLGRGTYDFIDPEELAPEWIENCLKMITKLVGLKCMVGVVFDGPLHPMKAGTREERDALHKKAKDDVDALLAAYEEDSSTDMKRWGTLATSLSRPEGKQWEELRNAVAETGVQVYRAEHDAEKLACQMARRGSYQIVLSSDSDCLAFGAPQWVYIGTNGYELVDRAELIKALGVSESTFLDFCICLGCDYNTRIPGIGPVRAWKNVREIGLDDWQHDKKDQLNIDFCREYFREPGARLPDEPPSKRIEQVEEEESEETTTWEEEPTPP